MPTVPKPLASGAIGGQPVCPTALTAQLLRQGDDVLREHTRDLQLTETISEQKTGARHRMRPAKRGVPDFENLNALAVASQRLEMAYVG